MVALVVGTILMALIVGSYWTQSTSSRDKQIIVGMQQNMRSAMFFMERDIRMAGYDPHFQDLASETSITAAAAGSFSFRMEDDDGNLVDTTYSLADPDGDGIFDLEKQVDADPPLYVAKNIEAVEFCYTLADGGACTTAPTNAELDDIRAVGISLLARGSSISSSAENNITYTTLSGAGWGPFNDGVRRQLVTTTIKCRNMFPNS